MIVLKDVNKADHSGSLHQFPWRKTIPLEKKSVCNKSAQTCLEYAQTLRKVCFFEIDQYAETCESMRKLAGFLQTYANPCILDCKSA